MSSRPDKISVTESSVRRHRYNYRYNINAEGGDKYFDVSPPANNNNEDLSDIKVVEKANTKI